MNLGEITATPTIFGSFWSFCSMTTDVVQMTYQCQKTTENAMAVPRAHHKDTYLPEFHAWLGEEGKRYRVPLMDVPNEVHAVNKSWNVRILMDNVRKMAMEDTLPCTEREKEFWTAYRYFKYQHAFQPLAFSMPILYLWFKVFQDNVHVFLRGRHMPIGFSIVIAEQWYEATFPTHQLLDTALSARTPLGDAARAEWQRLEPYNINLKMWTAYHFRKFIRDPIPEFEFGNDPQRVLQ
jgi:hypothetical protein